MYLLPETRKQRNKRFSGYLTWGNEMISSLFLVDLLSEKESVTGETGQLLHNTGTRDNYFKYFAYFFRKAEITSQV